MNKKSETKFNPLVSIVIPVYNGENYVSEAIESALNQTYNNIEIIVVDDGSKDNTEKICKEYGDKIRYFKKENGGTSTALNMGIKNMKGEYFSWLSHDDQYYPDKIKRQIEELSKLEDKNTIMMTDLDGIDENYNKIYETHYINHIKAYPKRAKSMLHPIIYNQTHGCTLLFPKACFEKVGLFDETSLVAQDFEFFYRAFSVFPHKLIPEILVTARDSSNRQGRRSKVRGSIEYSDLFIKMMEEFTDEDYKNLAPSKMDFYSDMMDFYYAAGYDKAFKYVSSKVLKNLQVSSFDLIGNKFNGHDLHKYLRENGILSKQLVQYKHSEDTSTYTFNFNMKGAEKEFIKNRLFYETDIVHFHLIHNLIDPAYLPYISNLKPCVITFHDPFFLGGHCVHHFDCEKWKEQCQDCPYLDELFPITTDYSSLNFYIKNEALKNSQISIIVASDWMKNKVLKSPLWKDKKIYKIPFGIDTKKFNIVKNNNNIRKELEIPETDLVIMFRSVADRFKGLNIIKEALKNLKTDKHVTIITTDQIGLLKDINENYDFTIKEFGWVDDDELLAKLYQACDIFLMPSKQETFGMMAIEAMACGKFVLCLDTDGSALKEIVASPKYGLAVKEEEFTKSLNENIKDLNKLKEKGKQCRAFAENTYSKELYIKNIISAYKEIIKNHNQSKEASIVLNQMLKNKVFSEINAVPVQYEATFHTSIPRRIYRLLPLQMRKKLKQKILNENKAVYKSLKKKITFEE